MKGELPPVPVVRRYVFPRIRAGASLKVSRRAHEHRKSLGFPPHSCGGLIEGTAPTARPDRTVGFSPAFVRGPH